MDESARRMVDVLHAAGHAGKVLEHARSKKPTEALRRDLEAEIVREMASALGRAEEKVLAALARLASLGEKVDVALRDGTPDLPRRVASFNAQRDLAEKARWELLVHREALGFRRNEMLAELYPIPPRRTLPNG